MLVKMRCVKRYEGKTGEKYAELRGEVGKAVSIKEKYQNVPLKETGLYLVEIEAKQKDSQAFLTFNVLAEIG